MVPVGPGRCLCPRGAAGCQAVLLCHRAGDIQVPGPQGPQQHGQVLLELLLARVVFVSRYS